MNNMCSGQEQAIWMDEKRCTNGYAGLIHIQLHAVLDVSVMQDGKCGVLYVCSYAFPRLGEVRRSHGLDDGGGIKLVPTRWRRVVALGHRTRIRAPGPLRAQKRHCWRAPHPSPARWRQSGWIAEFPPRRGVCSARRAPDGSGASSPSCSARSAARAMGQARLGPWRSGAPGLRGLPPAARATARPTSSPSPAWRSPGRRTGRPRAHLTDALDLVSRNRHPPAGSPGSLPRAARPSARRRRRRGGDRATKGCRSGAISLLTLRGPIARARVPQMDPPGQESGRRRPAGAGTLPAMLAIEPPDPHIVSHWFAHILAMLGFGVAIVRRSRRPPS